MRRVRYREIEGVVDRNLRRNIDLERFVAFLSIGNTEYCQCRELDETSSGVLAYIY